MSRRVKILISALVVALLLTGGAAAIVMAQDEPTPPPETNGQGLMARVAQILGIPREDLIGAFQQARQEMRQEVLDRALDKAVEKGIITEGEAIEINEWLEQKPEALNHLRPAIKRILRERHCQRLLRAPNLF